MFVILSCFPLSSLPLPFLLPSPLPPSPTLSSSLPSPFNLSSPPSLTLPAHSTHGLLQLVSAQNITTVGSISSLSEQEVQTLPIKSPKVLTLRGALRSFEQQLQVQYVTFGLGFPLLLSTTCNHCTCTYMYACTCTCILLLDIYRFNVLVHCVYCRGQSASPPSTVNQDWPHRLQENKPD